MHGLPVFLLISLVVAVPNLGTIYQLCFITWPLKRHRGPALPAETPE